MRAGTSLRGPPHERFARLDAQPPSALRAPQTHACVRSPGHRATQRFRTLVSAGPGAMLPNWRRRHPSTLPITVRYPLLGLRDLLRYSARGGPLEPSPPQSRYSTPYLGCSSCLADPLAIPEAPLTASFPPVYIR